MESSKDCANPEGGLPVVASTTRAGLLTIVVVLRERHFESAKPFIRKGVHDALRQNLMNS